jgi:hypothetical protein
MIVRLIEQPPQKLYKSFNEWQRVHDIWKTKGFWNRIFSHIFFHLNLTK